MFSSVNSCAVTPPFSYQYVLTLSKAHGNLSALTADVHEFRVEVCHSLGQKQNGVFVLFLPHPEEDNNLFEHNHNIKVDYLFFQGIVHPKMKICKKFTHLQAKM